MRTGNSINLKSIGVIFRKKRSVLLKEMIERVYQEIGSVDIIDLGGTEQYWHIIPGDFLFGHNVRITVVNLPGTVPSEDHGCFRFIAGDACRLTEIRDKSFHISHSNSVLEHVGSWSRMVDFAKEARRVSERYYIQTPNYWFPIDPHSLFPFFHWLPQSWRVRLLMRFQLGWLKKAASVDEAVRLDESIHMIDRKMVEALFVDARVFTERVLGLPKSFIAIKE